MVRIQAPSRRSTRGSAGLGTALALLILTAASGAAPAGAADDPLLSRLVGEWIGSGTARITAKSDAERVYCRIVSTLVDDNTIEQKGRCSVASNSGSLASTISARGGGRYEGVMNAPSVGSANFAGNGSGNRLQLIAEFLDRKTREPRKATVIMSFSGAGYRVVTSNAGGSTDYVASDIMFQKK